LRQGRGRPRRFENHAAIRFLVFFGRLDHSELAVHRAVQLGFGFSQRHPARERTVRLELQLLRYC
jgi:hypothetical protein